MKRLLIISAFLALFSPSEAQTVIGNQLATKITVAAYGATQNALLSLPDDYSETKENYPLIIFLHGLGEKGSSVSDLNKLATQGLPKVIAAGKKIEATHNGKLYKFIVLSPQHHAWTTTPESLQYMLTTLGKSFRIDTNRIYLTGLSAGGQGVIQAILYNDWLSSRFAAVVPMSPAHPGEGPMKNFRYTAGTAAWFFAGTASGDNTYRLNALRYNDSINRYNPGGSHVTLHPGGHCCWSDYYDPSYRENGVNIYEWMLAHAKGSDPVPPEPEPEPVKYIQIAHDPAKILKVIILDTDGKWTEYDSTSVTSGAIKISTK